MAQRSYTLSLQDADFPMLTRQHGRTTLFGNKEEGAPKQPKIYYCHNVMPTSDGVKSVGYMQETVDIFPAVSDFQDVREIYGNARTRLYLGWTASGSCYLLIPGYNFWSEVDAPIATPSSPEDITLGLVNGVTYIFYKKTGCLLYNEATEELEEVILTGLDIPSILGIVASSGYLLAYSKDSIAWSSTILPTDFVPSQVTGAGAGTIANIGGSIRFILANSLGILAYSDTNVIGGTYTGNVQYPFKFREIEDSQGGTTLDNVAYESNSSKQFVFTTGGLQAIDSRAANTILPAITDFLGGKELEDFDPGTDTFYTYNLTSTMKKKVKLIASRYLVISYGIQEFTHALVYDIALERLGKLKITHTDVFKYIADQTEVSREHLAFVTASGKVQLLEFSYNFQADGVLILGKLQYSKHRYLTLLGVESENVKEDAELEVTALTSTKGKNFIFVKGYEVTKEQDRREHVFRTTGMNHSIMYVGDFSLVSCDIYYTLAGRKYGH